MVNSNFLEQEHKFVLNKYKLGQTYEEEEVDIIVQWQIPQINKKGFYSLFKTPLLKFQKQITEQQNRLQRQKSQVPQKEQRPRDQPRKSILETIQKVNPLHISYHYQKSIQHDFTYQNTLIMAFNLNVANMIQN
mmetsp:Transcript_33758/g.32820  ORF Transcript_33758/g.32820 Transcript_33758/m.32820 type:complete len:134 (-) Transcript_33758:404-805(-)